MLQVIGFKTISKGTLEKHIIECAKQAAEHKYKVLKVYMMLGLPDEQDEDIDELIKFTLELAVSTQSHWVLLHLFQRRTHTMDDDAFAGIKVVEKRINKVKKGLRPSKGRG